MTATPQQYDPTFGKEPDIEDAAAITAFWICGARALEYRKGSKAVVKDPYAELLMSEDGWKNFTPLLRTGGILNRIRFHDSNIINAAKDFNIRQMIILGAGLDTRAFRLMQDFPDMHVIEVDHPKLFAYKEPRLKDIKPTCRRDILALDYDEVTHWDVRAKEKFGFDPKKPTIFVLEGLTMYIPVEEEMELYRKVNSNAALNSVITGCSQKVFPSPRKFSEGVVWHDTDRRRQIQMMRHWGLHFLPYNPFGIGNAMMFTGQRKEEPYSTQYSILFQILMSNLSTPQGKAVAITMVAVLYSIFTQ